MTRYELAYARPENVRRFAAWLGVHPHIIYARPHTDLINYVFCKAYRG